MSVADKDVESGVNYNEDVVFKDLDFTEKSIRAGFIRKVYGLLMVQLAITLGFVATFMFVEPVRTLVYEQYKPMFIGALILMLVTMITLMCSTDARRKAPLNYICLFTFTATMSFFVGVVTSAHDTKEVLMALGICVVVVLGLTMFAFQTKYDFTMMHTGIFTLFLILFVVSVGSWFLPYDRTLQLIIAGFGAFIFSLLLIYDTQLIVGGNHRFSFSPEEYVYATLTLYLDIINLFLRILRIIRLS